MTAGEPEHGGGAGLVPLDWIMLRAGDVKALLGRVSYIWSHWRMACGTVADL